MFSKIYSQIKAPFLTIQGARPEEGKVQPENSKIGAAGRYTGTDQKEAKEELDRILTFVGSDTETLKSGALRLVQNWDGTYELKKRTLHPYHWFSFVGWGRDIGLADNYIRGVMRVAMGADANNNIVALSNYLTGSGKMTSNEIVHFSSEVLQPIILRDVQVVEENQDAPSSLESGFLKAASEGFPVPSNLEDALDVLGFQKIKKLGEGGFGTVYSATMLNKTTGSKTYAVKESLNLNKELIPICNKSVEGLFHQRGELAACCFSDHPKHITKPMFVIVALQKEKKSPLEYYYLSTSEAENFTREMGKKYPKAKVGIAAHFMEYVEGKDLTKCYQEHSQELSNPSSPIFQNLATQLITCFKTNYENGISHRDIKPDNIMLTGNLQQGDVVIKLIDWGLAAKSPQLVSCCGTRGYLSPRLDGFAEYGPEVDAYSVAMTLLALLDSKCFSLYRNNLNQSENDERDDERITTFKEVMENCHNKPKDYLEAYLDLIEKLKGDTTELKKKLDDEKNPFIRDLIGSLFQVAADGPNLPENVNALWQKLEKLQGAKDCAINEER